tara:strand:+ start:3330 stop:3527 length:198 start_codon:yes stop_codon:yes gene_type:complete
VFPESKTQICVVHQIRNACRYVVWKDKKGFAGDMKHIYNALNQQKEPKLSWMILQGYGKVSTRML